MYTFKAMVRTVLTYATDTKRAKQKIKTTEIKVLTKI